MSSVYSESRQSAELSDPGIITLVAESAGGLIGFAQLRRERPPDCVPAGVPLEINRFYVDTPWHGRGVAQALMRAVEDSARAFDVQVIWLGVWEHNVRAIAFYAKCGFHRTGSQPFLLGSDLQTDDVMVKVRPFTVQA